MNLHTLGLLLGMAAAPASPPDPILVISLADTTNHLLVRNNLGESNTVGIDSLVASAAIEKIRVLDTQANGTYSYAVLQLEGYYNGGCLPRGYCGCGMEENTVWLQFDANLNLTSAASHLTASCGRSSFSTTTISNELGNVEIQVTSETPNGSRVKLQYSSSQPEHGILLIDAKDQRR